MMVSIWVQVRIGQPPNPRPRRPMQMEDDVTAKQAWKMRKLLGNLEFVKMWNDYSVRGHLSHYGSLTARLAKHGLTIDELLPPGWDPREIWRKSA